MFREKKEVILEKRFRKFERIIETRKPAKMSEDGLGNNFDDVDLESQNESQDDKNKMLGDSHHGDSDNDTRSLNVRKCNYFSAIYLTIYFIFLPLFLGFYAWPKIVEHNNNQYELLSNIQCDKESFLDTISSNIVVDKIVFMATISTNLSSCTIDITREYDYTGDVENAEKARSELEEMFRNYILSNYFRDSSTNTSLLVSKFVNKDCQSYPNDDDDQYIDDSCLCFDQVPESSLGHLFSAGLVFHIFIISSLIFYCFYSSTVETKSQLDKCHESFCP